MSEKRSAIAEKLLVYCRSHKTIASFLQEMCLRGVNEIKPTISSDVSYPELLEHFGEEAKKALELMVRDGILKEVVVDRVLRCPECNTMNVRTRYLCPSCKSINVERVLLIEHLVCGFIGSSRLFKKGESDVCPRCGRALKKAQVDWRAIGMTFECYDCGLMFNEPKVSHQCIPNGHEFDTTNSKYEAVYKYVINDEVVELVKRNFLITSMASQVLSSFGYEVRINGVVKGFSGIEHEFNIIGSKNGQLMVIETSNAQSSKENLIRMVAKVMDTRPSRALLLVLSRNHEALKELQALATPLNIQLIVAKNLAELEETIKLMLSKEDAKQ